MYVLGWFVGASELREAIRLGGTDDVLGEFEVLDLDASKISHSIS